MIILEHNTPTTMYGCNKLYGELLGSYYSAHYKQLAADPVKAKVMYAVQQPLAGTALQEVMGVPAWKSLPSWYMVAADDQAIPPDAERLFARRMGATTVEVPASHVAMVSHPQDVVQLIKTAAQAVETA